MADVDLDQRLRDIQTEYLDFLDDTADQGVYAECVRNLIAKNERRLIVNINDLRRKNAKRATALLNNGFEELLAFERALKEMVVSADATYAKQYDDFFIGLEGSFGAKHVTPRALSSRFLGSLVCMEGIVTKCSLVRPKVVRSVHFCPATKKTLERRYTDLTSYDAFPANSAYPTKDDDGNLLETEYGLSSYKDHQTLSIQEMPEKSPPGQLPRSIDVVADNDLVDACKPGDRVQIVGIYRCLPSKKNSFVTGSFRTIIIANNIVTLSKEVTTKYSTQDLRNCKMFSQMKKRDVFDLLARSLAPSIHGHEFIKKSLLCMLLGGVEKILPNGTRLRGDINLLLLGDPSVAKSQLLRYVMSTAARVINTTGRGSSGVGLTAAVTTDQDTGERRLEAGAMVLADRGVVCIDEFDKMSDMDRTAIHEVMEQGRVTIAKAGIHARLNARCSVLAAANPVYGRYDQYKTPMENIGMQDSLLSRFDLLFIMLDTADSEHDRQVADHVVRMHRYRGAGEQDGEVLRLSSDVDLLTTIDDTEKEEHITPIFEKYDPVLHAGLRSKRSKVVTTKFMSKYILLAKAMKPILTKEAANCIAEEYSKLRSHDNMNPDVARTQPVTARALETLIRLSTAHAKARLAKTVEVEDAQKAIELVQYAYFKKVLEKKKKRKIDESDEESGEEDLEAELTQTKKRRKSSSQQVTERKPKKKPGEEGYDPYDFDDDEDDTVEITDQGSAEPAPSRDTASVKHIADDRLKSFKRALAGLFKSKHAQSMPLDDIQKQLSVEFKDSPFSQEELDSALDKMSDANQIMVSDNIVFLI